MFDRAEDRIDDVADLITSAAVRITAAVMRGLDYEDIDDVREAIRDFDHKSAEACVCDDDLFEAAAELVLDELRAALAYLEAHP